MYEFIKLIAPWSAHVYEHVDVMGFNVSEKHIDGLLLYWEINLFTRVRYLIVMECILWIIHMRLQIVGWISIFHFDIVDKIQQSHFKQVNAHTVKTIYKNYHI